MTWPADVPTRTASGPKRGSVVGHIEQPRVRAVQSHVVRSQPANSGAPTRAAECDAVHAAGPAGRGLLIAFVVDDIDTEHERLASAGITVITPPETEPWGERFSQYADPKGIVWQIVQWV